MPSGTTEQNFIDKKNVAVSDEHPSSDGERIKTASDAIIKQSESSALASHRAFSWAWVAANVLLLASLALVCYSITWEETTRIYLKGFSDAMVPSEAAPIDKIESILGWMTNGPHRLGAAVDTNPRDPEATLNYRELLHVCGTATNAFINIARSTGLPARRLLLLDHNGGVKHVVAEVRVDGKWIVVDPAFRMIPRDAAGHTLTRTQMTDPIIFARATANLPEYDQSLYRYDRTERVRLGKIPVIGPLLRSAASHWPGWSDSEFWTMMVERESFGFMILSSILFAFLLLFRFVLRWYGEKHLGVRTPRVRARLVRAGVAWFKGGDTLARS